MSEQEQTAQTESPKRPRSLNGLVIFAIIFAIVFAISYRPSVEAIYCDKENLLLKPDVVMLGTSWCPYCNKARKYFVNNKISYCEYDIEKNARGKQMYDAIDSKRNQMGMPLGIPVLLIGDYQLSGFDEDNIKKALTKLKPL